MVILKKYYRYSYGIGLDNSLYIIEAKDKLNRTIFFEIHDFSLSNNGIYKRRIRGDVARHAIKLELWKLK